MDQNSFRELVNSKTAASSSGAHSNSALLPARRSGWSTSTAGPQTKSEKEKPAFKPRKVKKQDEESEYRDRAAERRTGTGNDYAQVEAVLEEFEKKKAIAEDQEAIELKRSYLGGDTKHTVLVKGLDFALLAQNRARQADSTSDDEALESAFDAASGSGTAPRKRTREDMLQALKAKRQKTGGEGDPAIALPVETVLLNTSKFRRIGAVAKQAPQKESGKKKKKKMGRVSSDKGHSGAKPILTLDQPDKVVEAVSQLPPTQALDPVDDDVDIFAGAGDYDGLGLGGDEDEDNTDNEGTARIPKGDGGPTAPTAPPMGWFEEDDNDTVRSNIPVPSSAAPKASPERLQPRPSGSRSRSPDDQGMPPTRLKGLSSSVDIKQLLALSGDGEKGKKRRAGKGGKKAKKGAKNNSASEED